MTPDDLAEKMRRMVQSMLPALSPMAVGELASVNLAAGTAPGHDVWEATVAGILPDPVEVPQTRFSSVFSAEVAASGGALVGRRVEVHFVSGQAVIAYTLEDG